MVVGKWYKGEKSDYYFKFLYSEEKGDYDKIYFSERIYHNTYVKINDYLANEEFMEYALNNPVTIEELQRLLPKNHPDLLTKIYEVW